MERQLEQLLVNFPNLVSSYLSGRRFPEVREFGEINVCVRQGALPECNGRVDLAFVTETTVHVVELKRRGVSVDSLHQLKRYMAPVQARYPNHLVVGYLAGRSCFDRPTLHAALGKERVTLLLMGDQIPRVNELLTCQICGAGFHYGLPSCPYCTTD